VFTLQQLSVAQLVDLHSLRLVVAVRLLSALFFCAVAHPARPMCETATHPSNQLTRLPLIHTREGGTCVRAKEAFNANGQFCRAKEEFNANGQFCQR